ncbi:hypothetical protein C5167_031612 [Papaver somniferum]|uniref:Uncharacterized protein n=1 Tax=Papaver somniferum TaxID=3469 RepID=A0A4Y7K8M6_PAPSO|nr:hypothetical protein C5167_031612 [Papaver somniferum]
MYCLPRAKQWEKDFTIHAVCHRIDEYRGRYCSSTHLSHASTRKAKNNCIKVNEIRLKFNKETTTVAMAVGDTTDKSLRLENLQASRIGET